MQTKKLIGVRIDKAKNQNTYEKAKVYSNVLTKELKENRMKAWRCYRCDLTFKDVTNALMHKDILSHPGTQIFIIAA